VRHVATVACGAVHGTAKRHIKTTRGEGEEWGLRSEQEEGEGGPAACDLLAATSCHASEGPAGDNPHVHFR
jgi:hypothetical protein